MKTGFKIRIKAVLCLIVLVTTSSTLNACSKADDTSQTNVTPAASPQTFPIQNVQMKNCHFTNPTVTYTFNSAIPPNLVHCDEGVAKSAQLLSPSPLPTGLQFSASTLSLTGTATEKVTSGTYQFYLENEAGYVLIPLQITVQ